MEDERTRSEMDSAPARSGAVTTAPPPRRRRKWPWIIGGIILVPILLLALWTAIALNWSYSEGTRAGYIQKFSRKGWVCKTWEGEIAMVNMPGAAPEKFAFSVRDDAVAAKINSLMGDRVSITYKQHPGIPLSCFGETQYFVVDAKPVK